MLARLWYRVFHAFCNWVYFERITVIHPERLPKSGPVFYLGLHRNGAVDGFIYHAVLPRATFLISTQLRANPLGRIFFDGIEVVRSKDEGDRSVNALAMRQCVEHLGDGGELFVFPEGTSSLGPRHLPFKSGAAQLLLEYLSKSQTPIMVVPVGIHYERAWAFRSKVEVVVGEAISTVLPEDLSEFGKLKEIKRRIQIALETVGINVATPEIQREIEQLAYASTLGTGRSYFESLKRLESGMPGGINPAQFDLREEAEGLLLHQGVPLFPKGPMILYALVLALLAPIVAVGALLNLPPILIAALASWKLADDRNVISLWRVLVGIPLLVMWVFAISLALLLMGKALWIVAYAGITTLALKGYYRLKKVAVAVHNGLRFPQLRLGMMAFHERLLKEL